MIRVLHIIDSLGIGGTQPMLTGLCIHPLNAEAEVKHSVLSLHGTGREHFYLQLKDNNIEVRNLAGSKYNVPWILLRLIYFLNRRKKYNIIHLHLRTSTLFGAIVKNLFMINKPVVAGVYEQKSQLPESYSFFSNFRSQINAFVAMSDADKDDLNSTGIAKEKIFPILPLVDISGANDDYDKARQSLNSLYNIPPGHFVLMSLARVNKDRQINRIFEIMPDLASKGINAILLIVGDGPEKVHLQEYAKKIGIENNIRWAGIRYDIWNVLPGCDLYLSASAGCLVSLAAIEAMACSRPVVTYNINPMSDPEMLCQSRGYYIATRDRESFAGVVGRMLENDALRKESGSKAKEQVNSDLSIKTDTSVQKYIELYRSLITANV
jgi:glycosyltransferase involved in cell wall biosynthesis